MIKYGSAALRQIQRTGRAGPKPDGGWMPAAGRRMLIRAKAPLRVSFAGGGTDVPPYPEMEGGCVLSATIARYAYGTLRPRDDGQIRIRSIDYGMSIDARVDEALTYDGKLDLVKAAILKMDGQGSSGFDLFLHSEAPPGTGLGASSALAVTLVGLLKEFRRPELTDYGIAHLAYHIEREELRIAGGYQDQFAAAFGGFNYIEFYGDHVVVNPLRLSRDILNELEHNMLLIYTGGSRSSHGILDDQVSRYREESTLRILRELKRLAGEMKDALLQREFGRFGALLHDEWMAKRRLSSKITTPFIDELYEAAQSAGAIGGKVTGAGGGGYMLLCCPFEKKHSVGEVVRKMGGVITEVVFEQRGLQTWKVEDGHDN